MGMYSYGSGVTITETVTVNGELRDPTTVAWTIIDPEGTEYSFGESEPEFAHDEIGVFILNLPGTLHVVPGVWHYEIVTGGAVDATSQGEYTILQPAQPVDVAYAQSGPCAPWCDPSDIWSSCGSPVVEPAGSLGEDVPVDMTPYAYAASELLWLLSARMYNGRCEKTVRPCSARGCGFQVLSRGHIVHPGDAYGWDWDGSQWWNDGRAGCGCVPLDQIKLSGYPVREVIEVKIAGEVIAEENNWRLDERRFLTRLADADGNAQRWPACQRLDLPDTEEGTFSVTYAYGQDPPIIGRLAAAQLGCQVYQSSVGGECTLPNGTVRVTRQGITIDRAVTIGWFKGSSMRTGPQARWQTGLPLVDAFLNSVNPYGLQRRPVMAAPGTRRGRYAQSVGS